MKIMVVIKLVPDLVEELNINPDGLSLDTQWMRVIINEFDDHALEQAIILKEKNTAEVIVLALGSEGADEVLFTAIAKGADRGIRLNGNFSSANNHALAKGLAPVISSLQPDLVLTGVQANNDLDGPIGPELAACLNMPFIGYVSSVKLVDRSVQVHKEYPGGVVSEMVVNTPAVLGIQASEQPPRYVAVSKVRQVMKMATLEEQSLQTAENNGCFSVVKFSQPEASGHAKMLTGDVDQVADQLIGVFKELGVL